MTLNRIPKTTRPAPQRSPRTRPASGTAASILTPNSTAGLLALQQSVGNRALQRMLAAQAIQAKLTVGPANDIYEQEADKVAAQVLSNGAQADSGPLESQSDTSVAQPKSSTSSSGGFAAGSSLESEVSGTKGSGGPLPEGTRSFMETRFGADFSGVRVHTDSNAAQLNRSIQAEAFTHGNDIYFNRNNFDTSSKAGQQLLAHELTHVVQQTGGIQRKQGSISGGMTADRISRKKVLRRVDFIKMKRKETHIVKMLLSKINLTKKPDDAYGHWWTELGAYTSGGDWTPTESYGWWPSQGVGIKNTLGGVPGQLNGVANFGGSATEDPHHGDQASEFNPAMEVDDKADMKVVRQETIAKVRSFAKGFKGSWNWRLGWGKNCHTFQERMMKTLGMKKNNGASKIDSGDMESHLAAEAEAKEKEKQEAFDQKNPGINYKLTSDIEVDGTMGGAVTIPKDSVVRMLEQEGSSLVDVPDWQKIQLAWEGHFYETYKDTVTKNATPV